MIILGINNMHDASAALVIDGKVVAAAEEERFTRIKHTTGFPRNAIRFCLDHSGVKVTDLDMVAVSWKPWVLGVRTRLALASLFHSPRMFASKASRGMGQMKQEWAELFRMRSILEAEFGTAPYRLRFIDHHLSHASSAFLCSPFERAAILTIDGAGEADTAVAWVGEGSRIRRLNHVRLPHSLGQLYSAVTAFLGFKPQHDEYKVMGLAAYGEPVFADELAKRVLRLLPDGTFRMDSYFLDYHLARRGFFGKRARALFGDPRAPDEEVTRRHADIASSLQSVIEQAIFHLAGSLQRATRLTALCMSGGVAFNCVANGKLLSRTPFSSVFIQPAAGDAGGAIGAPLLLEHRGRKDAPRNVMEDVYLGPGYDSAYCEKELKNQGLEYVKLPEDELLGFTAAALEKGNLVFWFQGRMEWGPRALGNRSLLADPRRQDMKDVINLKIKQREPFRPFAPSVLEEKSSQYFGNTQASPFMLFTYGVKPDKRGSIPAVVHVDGTARPQTVSRSVNPRYWRLISEFERRSGVPMVLNTSFNVQEPIVCKPEEAIRCFLRTEADMLVLNDVVVQRKKKHNNDGKGEG